MESFQEEAFVCFLPKNTIKSREEVLHLFFIFVEWSLPPQLFKTYLFWMLQSCHKDLSSGYHMSMWCLATEFCFCWLCSPQIGKPVPLLPLLPLDQIPRIQKYHLEKWKRENNYPIKIIPMTITLHHSNPFLHIYSIFSGWKHRLS